MIKVVRHCKLYSRSLIPNMIIQLPYIVKSDMKRAQALQRRKDLEDQHKIVGVRFLCDHCDCLFEANGNDLDVVVVSAQNLRNGAFKDLFQVSANCPDCREKAIRYIWGD